VSTFHPVTPSATSSSTQPSTVFQPKIIPTAMNTALEIDAEPGDKVSKISDTESRFSNIKAQLSDFHKCLQYLKQHSRKEAENILPSIEEHSIPSDTGDLRDQMSLASSSTVTTGSGLNPRANPSTDRSWRGRLFEGPIGDEEPFFGDTIKLKKPNTLQIGFQNIEGFTLEDNTLKTIFLGKELPNIKLAFLA